MSRKSIPFKTMTLERATKYFDCEVSDFSHWWEEGMINLCIDCDDYDSFLLSFDGSRTEYKMGGIPEEEAIPSWRDRDSIFVAESLRRDELAGIYRPHGVSTGLFIPNYTTIKLLLKGQQPEEDFVVTPLHASSTEDCRVMIKIKKDYFFSGGVVELTPSITKGDLLIYSDDLLKIRDMLEPELVAPQQTIKPRESRKTTNLMAGFIKQLIEVSFGSEAAESPRKHIDGKTGEIRRQFEEKGITPPSGATVERWLKNADLD